MDTTRLFRYNSILDKEVDTHNYIDGTEEDVTDIVRYIELTDHLQEIYQLYEIYKYNLAQVKKAAVEPNRTEINATTIALVSAGRNIVESLDVFLKYFASEEEYNLFKDNVIHNEYDISFIYRFMCVLRNYSQHGHIPVSCFESEICFDLYQINKTIHFDNKLENEIGDIISQILEKTADTPQLAFSPSICSYSCSIMLIYSKFLEKAKEYLESYRKKCYDIYKGKLELLIHDDEELNGIMFYTIPDEPGTLHGFIADDESKIILQHNTLIVKNDLHKEKVTMEVFSKSGPPIGTVKGNRKGV